MSNEINIGDKCKVLDGGVLRNATVESTDIESKTYAVLIDGIGTKMSNIPIEIWRPIPLENNRYTQIPLAVSFADWISEYGWMRLNKPSGHKWIRIGFYSRQLTTMELLNEFIKEMNDEYHDSLTNDNIEDMRIQSQSFGGL